MKSIATLAVLLALAALALAACSGNDSEPEPAATPTSPVATATVAAPTATATPPTGAQACAGSIVLTSSGGEGVLLAFAGPQVISTVPVGSGWISPVLSPNGTRVAFFRLRPERPAPDFGLYVADATGQNERRLADAVQLHYHNPPVWSPRGDRIAFESASSRGEGAPADIFVVNADGSGLLNLTKAAVSASGPTWSADGTRLAFTVSEADGRTANIYTVNADGSSLQRVTSNAAGQGSWSGSWSPDGALIAFISSRDGNGEVYVIKPDGSGQTNLTRSPSGEYASPIGSPPLVWSPDGKGVAFLSDRHGNSELFSVTADGSGLVRLTNDPGDEIQPRWTSDGRCLTFFSSRPSPSGGLGVYIVGADGSGFAQLTAVR
jgi:TolB protein